MSAICKLRAVLCDQDGNVCIAGSDEDRRIINAAIAELELPPRLTEMLNNGDMEALLYRAGEEEELRIELYRRRQNLTPNAEAHREAACGRSGGAEC